MSMKQHIISALREQLLGWETLIASLGENQIAATIQPSYWTVKDVIAHLKAWQTRSISRVEAALQNREPEFPEWPAGVDPDAEDSTGQLNDWIYETYRDLPWNQVIQNWGDGYRRFIELSEQLAERDLLDSGRYSWLGGYPLAYILLASYEHHQEHYEKLLDWLQENDPASNTI